jgi:SAM-dependent methyltransferase
MSDQSQRGQEYPFLDTSRPHPARMYDYFLGGKDNFPADREAGDEVLAAWPEVREGVLENRAFLRRVVSFLAGEAGIRQFLDIGTGIPTQGNVHEVAHAAAPDARVVYVDNDPIVHVHANALLAGDTTSIILADLREPETILGHPKVREALDLSKPFALLLIAILHFITDEEDPQGIVARFRQALSPGSYLAISHVTADFSPEATTRAARVYDRAATRLVPRGGPEIARFFDGLELVEPGLVPIQHWRPEGQPAQLRGGMYGAVGRKP